MRPDALQGVTGHHPALPALADLLVQHGFTAVRVRVAGSTGEIAVVEAPPEEASRLAALAETIRKLGFRYVAIDLGSERVR